VPKLNGSRGVRGFAGGGLERRQLLADALGLRGELVAPAVDAVSRQLFPRWAPGGEESEVTIGDATTDQ
jgi:hypothetical protein